MWLVLLISMKYCYLKSLILEKHGFHSRYIRAKRHIFPMFRFYNVWILLFSYTEIIIVFCRRAWNPKVYLVRFANDSNCRKYSYVKQLNGACQNVHCGNELISALFNGDANLAYPPRLQGSSAQHGAHLGPTEPRWAPCWPHEPCYLGICGLSSCPE